jgi:hypothetical protein
MAAQSGALVYTIGIFDEDGPDRNPGVLRGLARATGGEVSTSAAQPGVYRSVRVAAGAAGYGKLSVRARAGYIAGEPGPIRNQGVP